MLLATKDMLFAKIKSRVLSPWVGSRMSLVKATLSRKFLGKWIDAINLFAIRRRKFISSTTTLAWSIRNDSTIGWRNSSQLSAQISDAWVGRNQTKRFLGSARTSIQPFATEASGYCSSFRSDVIIDECRYPTSSILHIGSTNTWQVYLWGESIRRWRLTAVFPE